jgi:HD-like signal output (HDOD) protein
VRRILFVDDEQAILDGLANALRIWRREWHMTFACGGNAALQYLRGNAIDVIVSDMRMPGLDGETLLRTVMERHPGVVRILFSGQTDSAAARRLTAIAHQYIAKPCPPAAIHDTVERICAMRDLLGDPRMRDLIGGIRQLPAPPKVYRELNALLENGTVAPAEIASRIESEPAITAKLLQIANSSFFGLARECTSVVRAVTYLGVGTVRFLVLSLEAFDGLGGSAARHGFDAARARRRALLCGRLAARIVAEPAHADDALCAGMLHEVGTLVLAAHLPALYAEITRDAARDGCPLHRVEPPRLGGITHAEVGAYLLALWGLPAQVVDAVAHQFVPSRAGRSDDDVLGAVHVAGAFAAALVPPTPDAVQSPDALLDASFVSDRGYASRLGEIAAIAEGLSEHLGEL